MCNCRQLCLLVYLFTCLLVYDSGDHVRTERQVVWRSGMALYYAVRMSWASVKIASWEFSRPAPFVSATILPLASNTRWGRSRWRSVTIDPLGNASTFPKLLRGEKVHETPSLEYACPPAAPRQVPSTSLWKMAWKDPGLEVVGPAIHMCASSMCVFAAAGCPWNSCRPESHTYGPRQPLMLEAMAMQLSMREDGRGEVEGGRKGRKEKDEE